MNTIVYKLDIPDSDVALLETLAKKFGWLLNKQTNTKKENHLDLALKAAETEKLFEANDLDVLMDSLTK